MMTVDEVFTYLTTHFAAHLDSDGVTVDARRAPGIAGEHDLILALRRPPLSPLGAPYYVSTLLTPPHTRGSIGQAITRLNAQLQQRMAHDQRHRP